MDANRQGNADVGSTTPPAAANNDSECDACTPPPKIASSMPRSLPAPSSATPTPPVAARPRRTTGPLLISLDGNIGAGKTTLLNAMKEAWPGLYTVKEPVDDWLQMKDHDGRNILELYYSDTARYAYTFQHVTLMTRIANTRAALDAHRDEPGAILVSERSILTDRHVFAEMLRAQGKLSPLEWELYRMWYALLADVLDVAGVVFLDTPVDTCHARILQRARPGEAIAVEYLTDLDRAHRVWLDDAAVPVLHVDTLTPAGRADVVAQLRAFADMLQARRSAEGAPSASPDVAPRKAPGPLDAPAVVAAAASWAGGAEAEEETPGVLLPSPVKAVKVAEGLSKAPSLAATSSTADVPAALSGTPAKNAAVEGATA